MSILHGKHKIKEIDESRCTIVEKNASKERVDFLKKNPRKNEIELFLVNLLSNKGTDTISEEWWTHVTNLLTGVAASLEKKQLTELLRSFKSYSSDMKLIAQKE